MTDEQRAHFSNLLLLCSVHHKLIDKIRPLDFSEGILDGWKADREGTEIDVATLAEVTIRDLEDLLEQVAAKFTPQREVTVDLSAILFTGRDGFAFPITSLEDLPTPTGAPGAVRPELVLVARNVGYSTVTIQEFRIEFLVNAADKQYIAPLVGNNSFLENPAMPVTIETGEPEVPWLVSADMVRELAMKLRGNGEISIRGYVRLSSGEKVTSAAVPIAKPQPKKS